VAYTRPLETLQGRRRTDAQVARYKVLELFAPEQERVRVRKVSTFEGYVRHHRKSFEQWRYVEGLRPRDMTVPPSASNGLGGIVVGARSEREAHEEPPVTALGC